MSERVGQLDHRHLWHPFTQQQSWVEERPLVIESAEGTDLIDAAGDRYIDGVSSLWCNVHGHRHPGIDKAVRDQLDRVAHSTMLGLTHEPAVELALKMAFQYWQQQGGEAARRTSYVCLRDAYHGDTIGAVSVGGIDLFHSC